MSFNKISEFLNIEPLKYGKTENFSNGDITFSNLTYCYDDYHKLINNYNLCIKSGSHILLKGPSGCGKSTLCKILNKNITDYEGHVKINGIDIKDYSLNTIRKNILYVSQTENIFSDTIRNNITLNKYVSLKDLNEVLEITKVNEIINKKSLRLDSFLYDSGYNLSGGERQRIILARSLLKRPKILILDESLSEMDKDLETEILSNIDHYLKDTTLIYISHTDNPYLKTVYEMRESYE